MELRLPNMRTALWTLNIDNYAPGITELTYPLMSHYAEKIGAEFKIIDRREYPDWPVTYEKLQIHELGQDYDWNYYLDSDALVHPDTVNWIEQLDKSTMAHNGTDMANIRWKYDKYFRRDGRNIGSCNWCTIASNWCLDLWRPLDDLSLDEALSNIYPRAVELNTVITKDHLIDDYVLSRNIARFGLKCASLLNMQRELNLGREYFFYHIYTETEEVKIKRIKEVIVDWELQRYYDDQSIFDGVITDKMRQSMINGNGIR